MAITREDGFEMTQSFKRNLPYFKNKMDETEYIQVLSELYLYKPAEIREYLGIEEIVIDADELLALYKSGLSCQEISKRTGIDKKKVRNIVMKEELINSKTASVLLRNKDEFTYLYSSGVSREELAAYYGVTIHAITRFACRNELYRRRTNKRPALSEVLVGGHVA